MPYASCENCVFRDALGCSLGEKPTEGQLLCGKYSMTLEFRSEIVELMRADINREIQAAVLNVRIAEMEKAQGFAG